MLKRFFLSSQENAQKSLESIAEHQIDNDTDTSLILYFVSLIELSLRLVQSQIRLWKNIVISKLRFGKGLTWTTLMSI